MAYKLSVSKQVETFLDKSEYRLRIKIITAFEQLGKDPRSTSLDIGVRVYKFKVNTQHILLAYRYQKEVLVLMLSA